MPDWESYVLPEGTPLERMKQQHDLILYEIRRLTEDRTLIVATYTGAVRRNKLMDVDRRIKETREELEAVKKNIAMDTSWNTRGADDGLL